ncbi:MAG: delta-60 repeat domain-containing protein [Anaerolineales bacterium]|nr:delta-60 repeat domain-containing protein [Anaerolineales bacterium]
MTNAHPIHRSFRIVLRLVLAAGLIAVSLWAMPSARVTNALGSNDGFDPGADGLVNVLAVQANGKIVSGGTFTTLDGQPRNRIGRLANNTAALQALTVAGSGSALVWTRAGSSPEVVRVSFELSTDGVTHLPLGSGTRIPGGWQLNGLALPLNQNILIRARGQSDGGSLVESVRSAYLQVTRINLPVLLR